MGSWEVDIDCLETFLAVARHGSFTRAAEARFLTQPAVSRQIRRLEDDLKVKLFQQTGRKVRLTPEGQLLLEEGHRIMAQLAGTRVALAEFAGLKRGRLTIGASSTPGLYLLPGLLAEFRRRHPAIDVRFELSNSQAIERMILQNDLELGFVGEQVSAGQVTVEPFAEDRIVIIAPAGHALARRKLVSLRQVIAEPYVAREPGSATRRVFEAWLDQRGLQWAPSWQLNSPEAVKQAVAAGLGLGAVSHCSIQWELPAKRLAMLRVKGLHLVRKLFLLYRRDRRLSAAARAFLDVSCPSTVAGPRTSNRGRTTAPHTQGTAPPAAPRRSDHRRPPPHRGG